MPCLQLDHRQSRSRTPPQGCFYPSVVDHVVSSRVPAPWWCAWERAGQLAVVPFFLRTASHSCATRRGKLNCSKRLNGLHEALRFTQEGEQECFLPFLDVTVSRTDDSIITSMYRKPTFTGRYSPWDSFSATSYKINLVRSLTNRVLRICSPSVINNSNNSASIYFTRMAR